LAWAIVVTLLIVLAIFGFYYKLKNLLWFTQLTNRPWGDHESEFKAIGIPNQKVFEAVHLNLLYYFLGIPVIIAIFLVLVALFAVKIPFVAYAFYFFDKLSLFIQLPVLSALGVIFWNFAIRPFSQSVIDQEKKEEDFRKKVAQNAAAGTAVILSSGKQARGMK